MPNEDKFPGETGISLSIYRVAFGLLMGFSLIRFWYRGWVEECYLSTEFHFTYPLFHWVRPLPGIGMHLVWGVAVFSAFMVALGWGYRVFIALFFLLFTYMELIEQSWYLNHYYFISTIAFLLCWMPANRHFSLDAFGKGRKGYLPKAYAKMLKTQISIVYFFAGLAKLNGDWLLRAQPLDLWLKNKVDVPFVGDFLARDWTPYLFSYGGAAYDLAIPFLLWNKRTRPFALIAVVGFHAMTALLFHIGMFPWIMMAGSMIFITDEEWRGIFKRLRMPLREKGRETSAPYLPPFLKGLFALHLIIQVALPLRYIPHKENQLWTERHYRFSWNVMLAEKSGSVIFKIKDPRSGRTWTEYPNTHLSRIQAKQMSYQADMIWQYAQFLKGKYMAKGVPGPEVYATCFVAFNGRPSRLYLPKDLDLTKVTESGVYDWVRPI